MTFQNFPYIKVKGSKFDLVVKRIKVNLGSLFEYDARYTKDQSQNFLSSGEHFKWILLHMNMVANLIGGQTMSI